MVEIWSSVHSPITRLQSQKVCAMCMSWAQAGTSLASIENEGEFDRYDAAAGQNTVHSWKIWKARSKPTSQDTRAE